MLVRVSQSFAPGLAWQGGKNRVGRPVINQLAGNDYSARSRQRRVQRRQGEKRARVMASGEEVLQSPVVRRTRRPGFRTPRFGDGRCCRI